MFNKIFIFNNYNNSSDVSRDDTKGWNQIKYWKTKQQKRQRLVVFVPWSPPPPPKNKTGNDGDVEVVLECG